MSETRDKLHAKALADAQAHLDDATDQLAEALGGRRQAIRTALADGWSKGQVARVLGISRQAVAKAI